MSTTRFEACLAFVLKWEGSKFTNDPDDHGGATRYGIIQREYDRFRMRRGQPTRSVNFIAMDEVREIYQRDYWTAVEGDRLPAPLDMVTFDTAVLMGVGRAIRFLQRSLNVGVDGDIGPQTRNALAAADGHAVAERFADVREAFLRAIVARDSTQQKFLKGWLNRLNDLRRAVAPQHELAFAEAAAAADVEAGEPLRPDEDAAAGRAILDLPDEFGAEDGPGESQTPRGFLLETFGAAAFITSAAPLAKLSGATRYVIDVTKSNPEVLWVAAGQSGPGGFGLPVTAVETLTPLALEGGDPTKVVAAVVFRSEFRSLAATVGSSANGGPARGFYPREFVARAFAAGEGAGYEDDPASPTAADLQAVAEIDAVTARVLANFGAVEPGTTDPPSAELEFAARDFQFAALQDFQGRTMALDINIARNFLHSCMTSTPRVRYGLGAKVPFHGAVPGTNFQRVDCSGFIREAIWRATAPHLNFPDGSVVQHDWVRAQGFTRSTSQAALQHDGAVRIAFLRPQDISSHIGHVVIIQNGRTLESHGGVGPDERDWTNNGWQARTYVYFLTAPTN